MLKSFVEFVGIFKGEDPMVSVVAEITKEGFKWETVPNPKYCVRQNFTVGHAGPEDLAQFVNKALQEIAILGGMMVHKKEPHQQFDFSNQVFVPMHMFSRIECIVKRITTTPENPDALETKEMTN